MLTEVINFLKVNYNFIIVFGFYYICLLIAHVLYGIFVYVYILIEILKIYEFNFIEFLM